MNKSDVDIFEKLSGQLISVYDEVSLLSKKPKKSSVEQDVDPSKDASDS